MLRYSDLHVVEYMSRTFGALEKVTHRHNSGPMVVFLFQIQFNTHIMHAQIRSRPFLSGSIES